MLVLIACTAVGGYLWKGSARQWLVGIGTGLAATIVQELRTERDKNRSPRRAHVAVMALVLGTLLIPLVSWASGSDSKGHSTGTTGGSTSTSPGTADSSTTTAPETGGPDESPNSPLDVAGPDAGAPRTTSNTAPRRTEAAPSPALSTTTTAPTTAVEVTPATTSSPTPTIAPASTTTTQPPAPVKAYNFNAQASGQPYTVYELTPRQYVYQPFFPRVSLTTYKYFRGFHFIANCSTSTCVAKIFLYTVPSGTSAACSPSAAFGIRKGWNEYDVVRGKCALDPSRTYYVQVYATEESVGTISLWLANNAGRDANLNAFAPAGQKPVAANTVLDSEIWLSL